jgi:hypothetical protein
MANALNSERRLILLGSRKRLLPEPLPRRVSLCRDRSELEAAVSGLPKVATWVSFNRAFTDMLLEKVIDLRADLRGSRLLALKPPRAESIAALLGLFDSPIFGLTEDFRWLPGEELIAAILRNDASDRFIGGSVDPKAKTLMLLRGNLKVLIAPFSIFPASGDGTRPDFTKLGFTDYGRTVVLGTYEAAADAILYELDAEYRRRLNKERRQTERSFGAALRRLRKQRRLKRTDFSPVSAKEIARIERNEVGKPHSRTLQLIADRLGVRPEEIASY